MRRNYSICAPAPSGRLRIGVKRLDGGVFSGHATSTLKVGDVVDVMTPTGRFTPHLEPAQARHYCAIAAGSGITPVLSIVATVLEVEPASTVTLVYGNRTSASVMFLEELADLKDRYPGRFRLLHVLSRERQEAELLSGRLDPPRLRRLLDALLPVDTVDEWFLCGPFEMVEGAREVLLEAGVGGEPRARRAVPRRGRGAPGVGDARGGPGRRDRAPSSRPWTAAPRRSQVPRTGERVLDAVLAVRADAPYACKGGVCGTCRAKIVSGEVAMARNYALEADEMAAGFVLACQSVPVSDEVELDFDA